MHNQLRYGLLEADVTAIIDQLKTNERIHKIILFGSRAKGTQHDGSDIDLAIYGIDLTANDIINALVKIDTLNLPYKFDLILFDRIKEPALIDHINRVGIILYESY